MYYTIKKRKSEVPGYRVLAIRVVFAKGILWDRSLGIKAKEEDLNLEKKLIKGDPIATQRLQSAIHAYSSSVLYLSNQGKFTKQQFIESFNEKYETVKIAPKVTEDKRKYARSTLDYAPEEEETLQAEILLHRNMKMKYHGLKHSSAKSYTKLWSHVMEFDREWKISEIDHLSLKAFKLYFIRKDMAVYTFNRTVKELKGVLMYYGKHKGTLPKGILDDPFFTPVKHTRGRKAYLTTEELSILYSFKFDTPRQERVRDAILFASYTGLRSVDWKVTLKHRDPSGKFLVYKAQKTGQDVYLALTERVQEILDKYNGSSPPLDVNFNKQMKVVCELAGLDREFVTHSHKLNSGVTEVTYKLHECVSSHTCRRSFATNLFKAKVPPSVIRSLTGHTTDQALFNYIQLTNQEISGSITSEILNNAFDL